MVNKMKFTYKQNDYEIMLMDDPYDHTTFGMIAIFKVKYIKWDEDDNKIEVAAYDEYDIEEYEFINYFCDQEDEEDNLKFAKEYIDEHLAKLQKEKSIITTALSIIKDYYLINKELFEPVHKARIAQNIYDLDRLLKGDNE